MNPTEFFDLAKQLSKFGNAGVRSAVSRGYYAAFHLASSILQDNNVKPKGRSHGDITRVLSQADLQVAFDAQSLLGDLQAERVKADYRIHDENYETSAFANDNLELTRTIIELLEQLQDECKDTNSDAKSKLVEGFESLKRKNIIR